MLLGLLVLLSLGAWALTVYQAQTMDMPMSIAVRGIADGDDPPIGEDTMASMPGMAMSEPETDTVDAAWRAWRAWAGRGVRSWPSSSPGP